MPQNIPQSTVKQLATFVREEDLEDLENLGRDLQERSRVAGENGRVYLMQQYTRMAAMVKPEVERIRKRFDREIMAELRREEKRLKKQQRAEAEEAAEHAEAETTS